MAVRETEHAYIKDLHFEHKLWLNELTFHTDELQIFENRLDELVMRYTKAEVLTRLEQFQNKFIHQKEVIHELKHKVKAHEKQLSQYAEEHPVAVDHHYFNDHTSLREDMQQYRKIFTELKESFFRYLAEWM